MEKVMVGEDEDVVIKGSFLDKHLCEMGYKDFESVGFYNAPPTKPKDIWKYLGITKVLNNFCQNTSYLYSWILQEVCFSKKQMGIILEAEALLSDHAFIIRNFIEKVEENSAVTIIEKLLLVSSTGAIAFCILYFYYKPFITHIFTSSILCLISQLKYIRLCAASELQSLISLQNELHVLCKKGLKILRYRYKIKQDSTKATQHLQVHTPAALKYVQPITECLIRYMENMSFVYYNVSTIISELLPSSISDTYTITKFGNESLKVYGDISYRSLKHLYHIYILVQSEMLFLLGVAYNRDTWIDVYKRIPETVLIHIIKTLVQTLVKYKQNLSEVIDAFYNCEVEVVRYKYEGPSGSKLQNLYVHLDLTSHKLQLAYKKIISILSDIDNCEDNAESDSHIMEKIIQKTNDVYMQVVNAKTFAEYSNLLITRTLNSEHSKAVPNNSVLNNDYKLVATIDPEPVMDEVFEEYIKEECLKSLHIEVNYNLAMNNQLDDLLRKNFMNELKEALVDKQIIMSERESKALQRMSNSVLRRSQSNLPTSTDNQDHPITSLQPVNICDLVLNEMEIHNQQEKEMAGTYNPLIIGLKDWNKIESEEETDQNATQNLEVYKAPLATTTNSIIRFQDSDSSTKMQNAIIKIDTPCPFAINLPNSFLKIKEETFIGSGENSTDEFSSGECESKDA